MRKEFVLFLPLPRNASLQTNSVTKWLHTGFWIDPLTRERHGVLNSPNQLRRNTGTRVGEFQQAWKFAQCSHQLPNTPKGVNTWAYKLTGETLHWSQQRSIGWNRWTDGFSFARHKLWIDLPLAFLGSGSDKEWWLLSRSLLFYCKWREVCCCWRW